MASTPSSSKNSNEDTSNAVLMHSKPARRAGGARANVEALRRLGTWVYSQPYLLLTFMSLFWAGNVVLGKDPAKPDLVVATNGGSDLVYLPNKDKKLADRTIKALLEQDYVSGLFVDDALGKFPGTLPMSQVNLKGKAATPTPSIVVNFRSYVAGCEEPTNCSVEVADTVLRQGQGMHGSFGRGDTMNFMAAIGPDFKAGYVDALPVSNADVGMTVAKLMGLHAKAAGELVGRVMTEALPNGTTPKASDGRIASKPAANGLRTIVKYQRVLSQRYFDAAGFEGRTVGLDADGSKQKTAGK